jgi:hypothetical protein
LGRVLWTGRWRADYLRPVLGTRKPAPLWKCPKCGHRFVTKNLWHSCGRYWVADHLKGADPAVRKMYARFVALVRACGPVTIYAEKTRIVCMVRVRFAGAVVWKRSLQCSLWLTRRIRHPALSRVEVFGPRSYGHYFRFTDPTQLDKRFGALVREAYRIRSAATRVSSTTRS